MALLAVLRSDPLTDARLTSSLASTHELVLCQGWNDLWEAVRSLPLDGCVVDVYWPNRTEGFSEVRRLRKKRPTMAILVYSNFSRREMDLFELGKLKIDAVLLAREDESHSGIREAVSEALVSSLAVRVTTALKRQLPQPGPDVLRWAIENAHHRPLVGDLAEAFSLPRRSLARILAQASLPGPARLLLWGRLFRAARLLDEPASTVEQVALTLGYSTGAALGRALRRSTGQSPRELIKRGCLVAVLDAYLREETGRNKERKRPRWRAGPRVASYAYPRGVR